MIDPQTALYAALLARSQDDSPELAEEVADVLGDEEHVAALLHGADEDGEVTDDETEPHVAD